MTQRGKPVMTLFEVTTRRYSSAPGKIRKLFVTRETPTYLYVESEGECPIGGRERKLLKGSPCTFARIFATKELAQTFLNRQEEKEQKEELKERRAHIQRLKKELRNAQKELSKLEKRSVKK